jgi:uncharacterized protein (TIGR02118 family)
MIKVSVLYPHKEGAKFDHVYYRDSHMPMVQKTIGPECLSYTVAKGLGGGAPGSPPPFVAYCELFFDSVQSFQTAFGPHAQTIMADVPNYTDIAPTMQISEVVTQ